MTAIQTCSYAAFTPRMGTPVRITLGRPRYPEPTGRQCWIYLAELAPRGWYFRAGPEKFDAAYVLQLRRFGDGIEAKLGWLTRQFGPLVCCYERRVAGRQCHRLAFGIWWQERTGMEVPELDGK